MSGFSVGVHNRLIGTPGQFIFYTNSVTPATFDPSWINGGISIHIDYGDGTSADSAVGISKVYAAGSGIKKVVLTCAAGWNGLTQFDIRSDNLVNQLPALLGLTNLTLFYCYSNLTLMGLFPRLTNNVNLIWLNARNNQFSGSLPSLVNNVNLQICNLSMNQFTGNISSLSLATYTALTNLLVYENLLTGNVPNLSSCINLLEINFSDNQIVGYDGGLSLIAIAGVYGYNNLLTEAAVDALLTDCHTSANTFGTVAGFLEIGGAGNAAPSAAGLIEKAALIAAPHNWNVITN